MMSTQKTAKTLNRNSRMVGLFVEFSVTEDTFTASLYSGTLVDGMKSIINGTSKWNDSLLYVGYYEIPSIP
ncbi:hypothetical protein TNCV_129101 [Trichonephila clavipes]|nr:hypothetical protein TNCV_129101 [Trichonephila clavipes]